MRPLLAIAALALALAPVALGQAPGTVDMPAPDFRAQTLGARPEPRTLADYKGQVVLLNIWTTWCGGCREEMP